MSLQYFCFRVSVEFPTVIWPCIDIHRSFSCHVYIICHSTSACY